MQVTNSQMIIMMQATLRSEGTNYEAIYLSMRVVNRPQNVSRNRLNFAVKNVG